MKLNENQKNKLTAENFDRDTYYDVLATASNHYNIENNCGIDHLTITAFMNNEEKLRHLFHLLGLLK
jgi:hypothetical protein